MKANEILKANELVPGRRVLVASEDTLSACLFRAKLLQKAKDEGALKTLIKLFAGEPAVVVEGPLTLDGMCKIRTNVGTTASLPVGSIGIDPGAERRLKIKYEASVAHDMAAISLQESWRTHIARNQAKAIIKQRRDELEAAAATERDQNMKAQKLMVEGLAVVVLQALLRGASARRRFKKAQLEAMQEAGYDEEDPEVVAAASKLAAHYRGSSARRVWHKESEAAHAQVPQSALVSGGKHDEDALRACSSGDLHGVHVLFRDHGINVHTADSKGNSGLMLACAGGHFDVVRYLASIGASLTVPNYAGWAPLHRACFNGRLDVAKFLLASASASGAPVSAPPDQALTQMLHAVNHFGSTPLHVSIPNGHLDIAQLLVEKGSPVESRNASGDTPLNFAVVCRQKEIAVMLLGKGADRNSVNDEGRTPAESAVATGQPELANLFSDQQPSRGAAAPQGAAKTEPKAKKVSALQNYSRSGARLKDEGARTLARLFEGCCASQARVAMVGSAWVQVADELATVALRPHEAATVLDVLGLMKEPLPKPPRGEPPQPKVVIRLGTGLETAQDLRAAANAASLTHGALEVSPKHGTTARKKILSLVRSPKGAAAFVAERKQSVFEWSDATGRAFLADALGLPASAVRSLPSADGIALLALDAQAIEATAETSALPSILKHRLAFHCELLRAVATAEDNNGVVKVTRRSVTTPATAKSKKAVAPATSPLPQLGGEEAKGAASDYSAELDGMRVQVAHFSDLTLAMRVGSSGALPADQLRLARRAAASKGTVVSALPDSKGRVLVLLEDGLTVPLPPTVLYALPRLLLDAATLVVGNPARVVPASWLRQLLLTSNSSVGADGPREEGAPQGLSVGALNTLAECLGGALVTVVSIDGEPDKKLRVKVSTANGFESGWIPADALVPPPSNAAMRLLEKRNLTGSSKPAAMEAKAAMSAAPAFYDETSKTTKQRPVTASSASSGGGGRRLYRTEPVAVPTSTPEGPSVTQADPFGTQLPFVPPQMLDDSRVRDQIGRSLQTRKGKNKKMARPLSSRSVQGRPQPTEDPANDAESSRRAPRPKSSGENISARLDKAKVSGKRSTWTPVSVQTFEFGEGLQEHGLPQQIDDQTPRQQQDRFSHSEGHRKHNRRPVASNQQNWSFRQSGFEPGQAQHSLHGNVGGRESRGSDEDGVDGPYPERKSGPTDAGHNDNLGDGRGEDQGEEDQGGEGGDWARSDTSTISGGGDKAKEATPLRELVRERVEELLDDEMNFSTGGWGDMGERSYDGKLREMEEQMARREDELRHRADARIAKTRTKIARDSARMKTVQADDPDATLRKQIEKMSGQMMRKEREIKDTLERQRKIAEAKAARGEPTVVPTMRCSRGKKESKTRRNSGHRKKREDLFRADLGVEVDAKLAQGWQEANMEVGELAAAMEAASAEVALFKEVEASLRSDIRSFRRRQDRITTRLNEAHSSMGHVKLVHGSESEAGVARLEDEVFELTSEHNTQAKELQNAESRLVLLEKKLDASRQTVAHSESPGLDLDVDARLVHGIDRKAQLLRSRVASLQKALEELGVSVARQAQKHADQSSQLSVTEMTVRAMKAALHDLA